MKVHRLVVGKLQENTYILEEEGKALIVDPGDEFDRINEKVEALGLEPLAVLLTHTHHDHIGELDSVRDFYSIEVYVHPNESDWLGDDHKNLSFYVDNAFERRDAEHDFEADKTYSFGPFNLKVVETPGHSPGGVSFIFEEENVIISGDALFKESVGRTDLPGSDPSIIIEGIHEKLFTQPDHFDVYPGHGSATTIGHEKEHNPYCHI